MILLFPAILLWESEKQTGDGWMVQKLVCQMVMHGAGQPSRYCPPRRTKAQRVILKRYISE